MLGLLVAAVATVAAALAAAMNSANGANAATVRVPIVRVGDRYEGYNMSISIIPLNDKECAPTFPFDMALRSDCANTTALLNIFRGTSSCDGEPDDAIPDGWASTEFNLTCEAMDPTTIMTGYFYSDNTCVTGARYTAAQFGRCAFVETSMPGVDSALIGFVPPHSYNVTLFSDWACTNRATGPNAVPFTVANPTPGACVKWGETGFYARLFAGIRASYVTTSPSSAPTRPSPAPSSAPTKRPTPPTKSPSAAGSVVLCAWVVALLPALSACAVSMW